MFYRVRKNKPSYEFKTEFQKSTEFRAKIDEFINTWIIYSTYEKPSQIYIKRTRNHKRIRWEKVVKNDLILFIPPFTSEDFWGNLLYLRLF